MMSTIHKDRDENNHWTIIDYNWLINKLIITAVGHDIQKKLIPEIIIFGCSE